VFLQDLSQKKQKAYINGDKIAIGDFSKYLAKLNINFWKFTRDFVIEGENYTATL